MTHPDDISEAPKGPKVEDTVLGNLIGYRLKRAYMQIQPEAQRVLAEDDLRVVSFSCLSIITDNPGIVQSELADALQMERSNLVVIIDELEQRGLIARKKVPTDRRRYALTATLRGRRLRDHAAERVRTAEDEIIGRLNGEDRAHLMTVLGRLEDKAR
ncbi:MarR family winged helix-turn-helix transcriptional regulator [Alloyangia pacifica]|uniref:MarR family winged helix-turn-helix transcriptional regulator n=1 Tax=Alloyangia pacifica TaxID=311180 RepID=UPI001CD6DC58|nr:MarR family transcriptional regulator [Alloyangia pacifica]MCA0995915.1 MarR family transcriptional regulator [Alloyangia pacifica]